MKTKNSALLALTASLALVIAHSAFADTPCTNIGGKIAGTWKSQVRTTPNFASNGTFLVNSITNSDVTYHADGTFLVASPNEDYSTNRTILSNDPSVSPNFTQDHQSGPNLGTWTCFNDNGVARLRTQNFQFYYTTPVAAPILGVGPILGQLGAGLDQLFLTGLIRQSGIATVNFASNGSVASILSERGTLGLFFLPLAAGVDARDMNAVPDVLIGTNPPAANKALYVRLPNGAQDLNRKFPSLNNGPISSSSNQNQQ